MCPQLTPAPLRQEQPGQAVIALLLSPSSLEEGAPGRHIYVSGCGTFIAALTSDNYQNSFNLT